MGITFNPFTGTLDFIGGAGGGGGTPSAPDTSVQFNDGGSFGGDAGLTWDKTSQLLSVVGADPTVSIVGSGVFDNFGCSLFVEAVSTDTTESVAPMAAEFYSHADNATGITLDIFGIAVEAQQIGAGDVDDIVGIRLRPKNLGGGTVGTITGLSSAIETIGNATLLTCFDSVITVSSGTTTDVNTIHINGPSGGGSVTNNYAILIGNQTKGTAINRAIKTGLGIVEFGDDVQLANGKAVKTTTIDAQTILLQAYDVDGTAYKTFATLLNGNVPRFTISQPAGGLLAMIAPTTDPGVTGAIWNDNGAPAFSA